jgi:TPP-dependent pyruvate/acetoin dehydrogenase alpha subunit
MKPVQSVQSYLYKKMMTWQQEVKACAKRYKAKKGRKAAKAKAAAKPEPPKVPRRVRGKKMDPANDIN